MPSGIGISDVHIGAEGDDGRQTMHAGQLRDTLRHGQIRFNSSVTKLGQRVAAVKRAFV